MELEKKKPPAYRNMTSWTSLKILGKLGHREWVRKTVKSTPRQEVYRNFSCTRRSNTEKTVFPGTFHKEN